MTPKLCIYSAGINSTIPQHKRGHHLWFSKDDIIEISWLSRTEICISLFIVLLFQADDAYTLSMMAMFWTVVVFYMCGRIMEVYGNADKDSLPTTLVSKVMSTALPTVLPTEDESIKLVVRMCLEVLHDVYMQLEKIFQCCSVPLKVNMKLLIWYPICFLMCMIHLCTFPQVYLHNF